MELVADYALAVEHAEDGAADRFLRHVWGSMARWAVIDLSQGIDIQRWAVWLKDFRPDVYRKILSTDPDRVVFAHHRRMLLNARKALLRFERGLLTGRYTDDPDRICWTCALSRE